LPTPSAGAGDGRVLDVVLAILESQTGYEREALDLDLDLEADLGIDTIKQAQVMARLREAFGLPRDQGLKVKDFPTIRHVVAYVTARVTPAAPAAPALEHATPETFSAPSPAGAGAPSPVATEADIPRGIGRMGVRWTPFAIEREHAGVREVSEWTVLVTDDGLGVADALAGLLRAAGARVEILETAGDLAAARSRLGRVRALVLLHPLAMDPAVAALDASAWRSVLDRKVGASFRAIKALKGEMDVTVAVTATAGPYGWRGQLVDPAGAGVVGLLKTLGHETPATQVKAIDIERPATQSEAAHVAATILREIERGGPRTEVAYRDGLRLVPRVVQEPLDLSAEPARKLGPDSVVIAFGGSRGVTAAIVKELARRYQSRLVLVGTRPQPSNVAGLAALDADGLKQLKQKIAHGWKSRMTGVKPIEIERQYAAVLQAIETYRTLEACAAAGASVTYHACDARDAAGVQDLVRGALRQYGRLDGVIFGAGTIEDKLIEDKTVESFDRVFGVKAEGLFNIYKALDGVTLSFLIAFSSVAGRFGNAGQADYAAGNEVVARLVGLMQAARPESRCVSIDWTGWDEVGLAARSGVIELMKEGGFEALSPAEGARFFHEEVVYGTGPEEIVIAGMGLPIDRDGQLTAAPYTVPEGSADTLPVGVFVHGLTAHAPGAWLTARARVEPDTDRWLSDHVIDGAPLVPAVFGIEMMAEAACRLFPGWHLTGIRDLRLQRAIKVLKGRAVTLKIRAEGRTGHTDEERIVRVRILSDFIGPDGRVLVADREHYTGEVLLSTDPPVAGPGDPRPLAGVAAEAALPPLYGEGGTLPHGPTFRVIERVNGLDGQGVVASVAVLDEGRALPSLNGHRLLTLPFAREAAFQSAGLWGILRHGNFGLPHGCRALHHFGTPPPGTRLVVRAVPTAVDAVRMEYDIDLLGDDGRLYDRMEGFYTVNPLAAVARTADGDMDEASR
jgi:NAD(P)-dependent dehydrogenase (short-subunit alcohol dehydrogenase family)/acyl carrier protein/predicted hotdog family 3-hydroxylacyl-ACP dehydratase